MTCCRALEEVEGVKGCRTCNGDQWGTTNGGQRVASICTMGGVVEDVGEGRIRYNGGTRKCAVVRERMGVEEVKEMVCKTVGLGVTVDRMWYSLKYDRNMKMAMVEDTDVRMMFRGNDEHGYVYVSGKDNIGTHVSNDVGGRMGRTGETEDGIQRGSGGRLGEAASEEQMEVSGRHDLGKR